MKCGKINEKKSISSGRFHEDNVKTFNINRCLKLQLPLSLQIIATLSVCGQFNVPGISLMKTSNRYSFTP